MKRVSVWAALVCSVIYIAIGAAGYAAFGSGIEPNILISMQRSVSTETSSSLPSFIKNGLTEANSQERFWGEKVIWHFLLLFVLVSRRLRASADVAGNYTEFPS